MINFKNFEFDFVSKNEKRNTCAVIGNSNCLIKNYPGYGKFIDGHSYVIRCNLAPVSLQWHYHVGSKTNLRVVNCHAVKTAYSECPQWYHDHMIENFPSYRPKQLIDVVNNKELVLCKDKNISKDEFADVDSQLYQKKSELIEISDYDLSQLNSIIESPTTGFIATMIALKHFRHVNLFGFSFYQDNSGHYYEELKAKDQSMSHNLSKEEIYIKMLEEQGYLKVFK